MARALRYLTFSVTPVVLLALALALALPAAASATVSMPPRPVIGAPVADGGAIAPGTLLAVTVSTDAALDAGDAIDFDCALDDGDWSPCATELPKCSETAQQPRRVHCTQSLTFGPFTDGLHELRARAVAVEHYGCNGCVPGDTAEGPGASLTFTVDTDPPLMLIGGPPPVTSQSLVTVIWAASEPVHDVTCTLDGSTRPFGSICKRATLVGPLNPGKHVMTVYGYDSAGNRSLDTVHAWEQVAPSKLSASAIHRRALKRCRRIKNKKRRTVCVKRARMTPR